jgi:hypothetical protein
VHATLHVVAPQLKPLHPFGVVVQVPEAQTRSLSTLEAHVGAPHAVPLGASQLDEPIVPLHVACLHAATSAAH